MDSKLIHALMGPITPAFGLMLILTGLYSLYYNATDARRKNHRRAEAVSRTGGWIYIAAGAILLLLSWRTFY